eukprot:gb/GECG01016510.1/.p1 GENE.gb/GECG01016510.1/~~gb/GECG01016510.1/.p1  ORF type:complete len:231 (+),score=8.07 gb/GECG01016510.1/:1-693(+)
MDIERFLFRVHRRVVGSFPLIANDGRAAQRKRTCVSVCLSLLVCLMIFWLSMLNCTRETYLLQRPEDGQDLRKHHQKNCFRQVLLLNNVIEELNGTLTSAIDSSEPKTFLPNDLVLQIKFLVSDEDPLNFVHNDTTQGHRDRFDDFEPNTGFDGFTESRWEFATTQSVLEMPRQMRTQRGIRVRRVTWPVLWRCSPMEDNTCLFSFPETVGRNLLRYAISHKPKVGHFAF